jgi:uncharacterized protein (TIGR02145 family)
MKQTINLSIIFSVMIALIFTACNPFAKANSAAFNPNFTYGTLTDQDGNTYRTIKIGTQTWMAENLYATHYRDGSSIPNITDSITWWTLTTGGQCTYNNTTVTDSIIKYGRLYNWHTVSDNRNIAPIGWHIPTKKEIEILKDYVSNNLGISQNTAKAISSSIFWNTDTIVGTVGNNCKINNSTGFSALPSGQRSSTNNYLGEFVYLGNDCNWWTATSYSSDMSESWNLSDPDTELRVSDKHDGFSIRCVKDY